MMTDLERLLAEHGMGVPRLDPLLDAGSGVTVLGFSSAGEQALAWWRRLREVSDRVGHWPLLLSPEMPAVLSQPRVAPAVLLARAAELDGAEVLARHGGRLESLDEQQRRELLARWPQEPCRYDGFRLPFSATGQPDPTLVALVPAQHGWQVPAVLGYGGWNDYPPPAEHSAILRYWHDRYGAELVCMSKASVELMIARPPRTHQDALAFAWEYCSYCYDGVDVLYEADDVGALAASLIDAEVVHAWWD